MLTSRPAHPLAGAAVGAVGIGVVLVVFWALPTMPTEIPALVTLVPITAASVLSGWRAGVPLAVAGGIAHALVFVHPIGRITFGYTQDVVVLLTYVGVAAVVSVLVSRRSIANQAQLIGQERMLLLRSVSHDLRNPLHAILAASTELLDGADHDPEMRRRLLELVVGEAGRVDRMVDNLLSLSRLQAGALVPSRQTISSTDLVHRCVTRFERLVGGDTTDLGFDVERVDDLDLDVDPVQVDQVLTNLVENSVRHCPGAVRVTIEVAADDRDPSMAVFRISDDGPGFPQATRLRGPAAFSSTAGSTGLGLTVCTAVVAAHGGTFTIDESGGHGARVRFTLPRA